MVNLLKAIKERWVEGRNWVWKKYTAADHRHGSESQCYISKVCNSEEEHWK